MAPTEQSEQAGVRHIHGTCMAGKHTHDDSWMCRGGKGQLEAWCRGQQETIPQSCDVCAYHCVPVLKHAIVATAKLCPQGCGPRAREFKQLWLKTHNAGLGPPSRLMQHGNLCYVAECKARYNSAPPWLSGWDFLDQGLTEMAAALGTHSHSAGNDAGAGPSTKRARADSSDDEDGGRPSKGRVRALDDTDSPGPSAPTIRPQGYATNVIQLLHRSRVCLRAVWVDFLK